MRTILAFCYLALLSCQSRPAATSDRGADDKNPLPSAGVATDSQQSSDRNTDSATQIISITGPTLILAVKQSIASDSSDEASEATDDWSFYFGRAAKFLEARGIRAIGMLADTLRIHQDGKESLVVVPETAPLCYLTAPGHPPLSFHGFDSDADLIEAAAQYFWAGTVPQGRGDTLTPRNATADFVVTRPTVIAFFSRRALNVGRTPPASYADSARLVEQVESLRDTLNRGGVTLELTFKDRFTVLLRGAVDTVVPIRSGAVIGYYAVNPADWQPDFMVGFWPSPRLLNDIHTYVHRLDRTTTDSR